MGRLVVVGVGVEKGSFELGPPWSQIEYQCISRKGMPRVTIESRITKIFLHLFAAMV